MKYDLPYLCPCLSPWFWILTTLCPCYVSSMLYARIFKRGKFSLFGFIFVPFSAYGVRRYMVDTLNYDESYEESIIKSCCCINSFTQCLHEMKLRRVGVYMYLSEPPPDDDSSNYEF